MRKRLKDAKINNSLKLIPNNLEYYLTRILLKSGFVLPKGLSRTPIRWAIVGTGSMAKMFSTVIMVSNYSDLIAVSSRDINKAKSFAGLYKGLKYFGHYSEMFQDLRNEIDIVYVATPVESHYEIVKTALSSGLNVLCEKPFTTTADEARELFNLALDRDLFVMEAMWMNCLPTFSAVKEWIDHGEIGKLSTVRINFNKRYSDESVGHGFSCQDEHPVLFDFGVYAFAFIENFVNVDDLELSNLFLGRSRDYFSEYFVGMSNCEVSVFMNISSGYLSKNNAVLIGSEGSIEFTEQFNRTNMIVLYDKQGSVRERRIFRYKFFGYEHQLKSVENCILNRQFALKPVSDRNTLFSIKAINDIMRKTRKK